MKKIPQKTSQVASLRSVTTGTPAGDFHIIIDEEGIARMSGFGKLHTVISLLPKELKNTVVKPMHNHSYASLIQAYFNGNISALASIPKKQSGTPFQEKIWDAINTVPYGQTINYKQLASKADVAGAIRAAGSACGQNHLALLIPCHRIIKSDGTMGGYLYGIAVKKALLTYEKA